MANPCLTIWCTPSLMQPQPGPTCRGCLVNGERQWAYSIWLIYSLNTQYVSVWVHPSDASLWSHSPQMLFCLSGRCKMSSRNRIFICTSIVIVKCLLAVWPLWMSSLLSCDDILLWHLLTILASYLFRFAILNGGYSVEYNSTQWVL